MSQRVTERKSMTALNDIDNTTAAGLQNNFVAQFYVFRGEDYLGWDCFYKSKVSIGSNPKADLILDDATIKDIQAVFYFNGEQIIVSDQEPNSRVRVNGRAVKTCMLRPLDFVSIGPYHLKIKLQKISDRFLDSDEMATVIPASQTAGPNPIFPLQYPELDQSTFENKVFKKDRPNHDNGGKRDYKLLFDGVVTRGKLDVVKKNLAALLKVNEDKIEQMFSEKRITVKKGLDYETAIKYKKAFEKAGAILRIDKGLQYSQPKPVNRNTNKKLPDLIVAKKQTSVPRGRTEPKSEASAEVSKEANAVDEVDISSGTTDDDNNTGMENAHKKPESRKATTDWPAIPYYTEEDEWDEDDEEEDDDDDDDDVEALFSLKEKLIGYHSPELRPVNGEKALEVIKLRNNAVIDVRFLNTNEKYYRIDVHSRFCMAELNNAEECYFYFNSELSGQLRVLGTEPITTDDLRSPENLIHKSTSIYRVRIPENGEVLLDDGAYHYLLRQVFKNPSPQMPDPPKKKSTFYKELAQSAGFHMLLLLVMGLFISLPDLSAPPEPESYFVQIDKRQLEKLKPVPKPKKPKPTPKKEPPKPVVKKKKPVAKIKKKKPAVSKKSRPIAKRTSQKTASAGSKPKTSRSIKAGGGQGKGNVAKRNVKQAGILSMLGDSVGFKPNKALAAVTNLDAVSTTHVGGKNFKAGGIVGKLGSSKIEVPSSGRINTKGSTQVLRSGGAGAGGRVAALEKGKTGQKQVMAMVSAKLSKKVRIHGGMSREAVKRVIDQHLDEVNFCYENALIANPSIMGKIVFEWKIMMSGKVGEVKIKSSSIKSGSIHGCIKKAIKTWRFPKPSGTEVVVSYPFVFDIVGF